MTQYKDIPQPTDQRNVSQQDLLNNGRYMLNVSNPASITGIIPVDHAATADNGANPSDGFHKQVSYVNTATAPTSLVNAVNGQSSDAIVYSKSGNLSMLSSQNPGNFKYQLTTLNTGSPATDFAKFGTNTNYSVGPPSLSGGWTFLPGGLIMQYGIITITSGSPINNGLVTFPIAFPTAVYSITTSNITTSVNNTSYASVKSVTTANFTMVTSVSSTSISVYWQAIGK